MSHFNINIAANRKKRKKNALILGCHMMKIGSLAGPIDAMLSAQGRLESSQNW